MLFKCEACLQDFGSNGTLLRHISHRIVCRDSYGIERFDQMRFEAKLKSKRTWRQIDYKQNKYNTKNPNKKRKSANNPYYYSYVPVSVKKTFEGESFLHFFQFIFEKKKSEILTKLRETLTTKFDEKTTNEKVEHLKLKFPDYFKQTENYAFCSLFGKFEKTTFLKIIDEAQDVVLTKSIDEIQDSNIESLRNTSNWDAEFDEKIEWVLEDKCSDLLKSLVLESYDSAMANAIEEKIEHITHDHIEYLKTP